MAIFMNIIKHRYYVYIICIITLLAILVAVDSLNLIKIYDTSTYTTFLPIRGIAINDTEIDNILKKTGLKMEDLVYPRDTGQYCIYYFKVAVRNYSTTYNNTVFIIEPDTLLVVLSLQPINFSIDHSSAPVIDENKEEKPNLKKYLIPIEPNNNIATLIFIKLLNRQNISEQKLRLEKLFNKYVSEFNENMQKCSEMPECSGMCLSPYILRVDDWPIYYLPRQECCKGTIVKTCHDYPALILLTYNNVSIKIKSLEDNDVLKDRIIHIAEILMKGK